MGITKKDCEFLFYGKSLGVSFVKVMTLGRLLLYVNNADVEILIKKHAIQNNTEGLSFKDKYAEPLFKILGASQIESLDYSNYEGATFIHDLNYPISVDRHQSFTCVIDSGTLEHIFDFPTAIKNAMNMIAVGGHYIGITPANNQMGHGFYQFSPELYYRIFSPENGFVVTKMLITSLDLEGGWYEVEDPKVAQSRGMIVNSQSLCLMLIAQKIKHINPFEKVPIQSDYAIAWGKQESLSKGIPHDGSQLIFMYRKLMPKLLKRVLRNIYDILVKEKEDSPDLGSIDVGHFKKFNF